MKTNSLLALANNTIRIIAPAAAGVVVAETELIVAFGVDAVTFLVSAGLVALLSVSDSKTTSPGHDSQSSAFWRRLNEGILYIMEHVQVRILAFTRVLVALGAGLLQVVFVVYIRETMNWGAEYFGLAMSAISIGSVVGASVLSLCGDRFDKKKLFALGTLAVGLSYIGLAFSSYFMLAFIILIVDGLADSAAATSFPTLAQRLVPNKMRGRFFSTMGTLYRSVLLLSAGLGGISADALGVRATLLLGGSIVVLAGVFALFSFGRLKDLSTLHDEKKPGITA